MEELEQDGLQEEQQELEQEEQQEEVLEQSENEGQTQETETEPEPEQEQATAQSSLDWSQHGLPQFAGRDPQEIAQYVRFRERQYGQQANELGELRRIKDEYEKLRQQFTKEQPKTEKPEDFDYKLQAFADQFNTNPWDAVNKYIVPDITEKIYSQVYEKLQGEIEPKLQQQAETMQVNQEWKQFADSHPDYDQHVDTMRQLMDGQYLGDNRPFDEYYNLSKLYQTNQKLAVESYNLMSRGLSFTEAKKYAEAVISQPAATQQQKESLRREVSQATRAAKPKAAKAASKESSYESMDDVLESVVNDYR